MKVRIIGAGAAGCFCAANLVGMLKEKGVRAGRDIRIEVLERGYRPMVKLLHTGGGRCNLTNTFESTGWPQFKGRPTAKGLAMPSGRELAAVYPRGYRLMSRLLGEFGPAETMTWFEKRGVLLKVEEGGRVFPISDDAAEIVRTIRDGMQGVDLICKNEIDSIDPDGADFTIVTTGGGPGMQILWNLDIEKEAALPSLFAFKLSDTADGGKSRLCSLAGISAQASIAIAGTGFRSEGAVLITDSGISGPAVLKLSSHAARHLADKSYHAGVLVNWMNMSEAESIQMLEKLKQDNPARLIVNAHPQALPSRLWEHLCTKAGIKPAQRWGESGNAGIRRLAAVLCNDSYMLSGRSRSKEEFVTCGGVAACAVDPRTLECKKIPGLYFAGEILDIDAVTGGFNLQAAWSGAYAVAKAVSEAISAR